MTDLYTKHKPIITIEDEVKVYKKVEQNDDFLFRKNSSISLNAATLEEADVVHIKLLHKNVSLFATTKEIKDYKTVMTFKGEVKYYYPIEKWKVTSGNVDWYKEYL